MVYLKIQKNLLGFLLLFRTRKGRKRTLELIKRIFKNFYFFLNFDAKSIFQPGRMLDMNEKKFKSFEDKT